MWDGHHCMKPVVMAMGFLQNNRKCSANLRKFLRLKNCAEFDSTVTHVIVAAAEAQIVYHAHPDSDQCFCMKSIIYEDLLSRKGLAGQILDGSFMWLI
ncbi:hypothetical protein A6R68_06981, partial [Neotoma lepida]